MLEGAKLTGEALGEYEFTAIKADGTMKDTLVLLFVAADASTSEKWAVSFADSPKAVRLSVTMSDTCL